MIGHYWRCAVTTAAYLKARACEKTTLAAIFGGAPLAYVAPSVFWQGFVIVGVVIMALMPSPTAHEGGCGDAGRP